MPRLPLPPITNFEAYNRNTKEQYEALGRFVAAFEAMVNETRNCSINLLQTDDAISVLADVTFHHPALTAKPLFEIFRALIIEFLNLPDIAVTPEEQKIFRAVLRTIATEYFELTNIRNTLLHGTWHIGYRTHEDPNSETFFLHKFKPTSGGLEREDVPTRAFQLLTLKDRCEDTRNWISFVHACVPRPNRPHDPVGDRFLFKDGKWRLSLGADAEPETLPRKSE
jgi:hypothetical protein